MNEAILLPLHVFATVYMTGLIWFVQVVHYPLMGEVGRDHYNQYQRKHMRLTSWVVGPPMLLESVTAILLLLQWPAPWTWTGVWLLAIIWLSTAFLQVPMHRVLEQGFDPVAHKRLVQTNWIRTAAWTFRSLFLLFIW
jgi:uncharacterized membrane protein